MKLSEALIDEVVAAVEGGLTRRRMAELLDVNEGTMRRWAQEGRAHIEQGDPGTLHAQFAIRVDEAAKRAERRAVAGIIRAAMGEEMRQTTTRTRNYKRVVAGRLVDVEETETVEVTRTERHWQAWAWWLERNFPQDYGRAQRLELTGKEGGPLQVETTDELRAAALASIEERATRLGVPDSPAALEALLEGDTGAD